MKYKRALHRSADCRRFGKDNEMIPEEKHLTAFQRPEIQALY